MADDFHGQCQRLYDAKAAQMILYGRALGLSHVEAEDVLQETFLAVMRLEVAPQQLDRYCLKVFRNRALNYRRGLFRRWIRERESQAWFEPAERDCREDNAIERLADLPAGQREVIVLKIWQQYTFEEIGVLTGTSPNTVAARYRYGLQKLRVALNGETYEHDRRTGERTSDLDPSRSIGPAAVRNLQPTGT